MSNKRGGILKVLGGVLVLFVSDGCGVKTQLIPPEPNRETPEKQQKAAGNARLDQRYGWRRQVTFS